ncbi:MbeCy [Morganella morganii]|uniref:MbeCy n=1 Tax=Morganella morganii TaxID=582 RepID=UPI0025A7E168|nr:MbeCy [Morganella morganii]EKW5730253.1 MbeCy [Morganella morganii]
MSDMKTEVVVIRLTKKEREMLDSVKTRALLADWMKELAFTELNKRENNGVLINSKQYSE